MYPPPEVRLPPDVRRGAVIPVYVKFHRPIRTGLRKEAGRYLRVADPDYVRLLAAHHGGSTPAHPARVPPGVSPSAAAGACATCHRTLPGGVACSSVFDDWTASPAAAAGKNCQSCHLPAGSHRFAGSRPADMLARAVALRVRAEPSADGPVAVVEVRDLAGHRLPDG